MHESSQIVLTYVDNSLATHLHDFCNHLHHHITSVHKYSGYYCNDIDDQDIDVMLWKQNFDMLGISIKHNSIIKNNINVNKSITLLTTMHY